MHVSTAWTDLHSMIYLETVEEDTDAANLNFPLSMISIDDIFPASSHINKSYRLVWLVFGGVI